MTEIEGLLIKIGADAEEAKAAFKGIQAGLDSLSGSFTAAGALLTGALTVPLAAIGAAGLKAGLDLDGAFDTIRVKTGQTGAALDGLQESFRNVFGNVAASAKDVGDAIASISSRTGQTGGGLEALTTQFLNLSRITGESLKPNIEATTRLFGDWGIAVDKQVPSMDMLFRASQQTGISFTKLAEQMVQSGAPFRQLGFSIEESAAMLAKWNKEGVVVENVVGGMKTALGKFAKAGLEPKQAFEDLSKAIKDADDKTALLIAQQAVGMKKGSDFAAAIREGRFEFTEFAASLAAGGDSIAAASQQTEDFAESWTKFKNQMTLALEPLGVALMKILQDLTPALQGLVGYVSDAAKAFAGWAPETQQMVIGIAALVAGIGPLLLGLGQVVSMIPAMSTGLAALGLSFAAVAQGALIAAAAIAAIQVGKAVMAWADAQGHLGKVIEVQYKQLDQLEVTAKKYGVTLERGKLSMDEYTAALNKAIRATPEYQAKLEAAGKAQEKLPPAIANTNKALDSTHASTARAGAAFDMFGTSSERASKKAEAAAAALANRINAEWNKIEQILSNIPRGIDAMAKALDEGFNAKGAFKNITAEMLRLQQQIADTGNASEIAIKKGMLVHLELVKRELGLIVAEQGLREVEKQFATLGASVQAAGNDVAGWAARNKEAILIVTGQSLDAGKQMEANIRAQDKAYKDLGITFSGVLVEKARLAQKAFEEIFEAMAHGEATAVDFYNANVKALEAAISAAKAQGKPWADMAIDLAIVKGKLGEVTGEVAKVPEVAKRAQQATVEMSQAWKDLGADMGRVWDNFQGDIVDAISGSKSFSEAFTNAGKAIKDSLINYVVKEAFGAITGGIKDLTAQFGGLGKTIMGVFSGGGSPSTPGAPNVGGGGNPMGGLTGMAGGITGLVGAIGSIGTMISSVIGNFQNARMEKTMNAIEESTRYIKGYTLQTFEYVRDWLPWLKNTGELLRLESIERVLYAMENGVSQLASGGSMAQNLMQPLGQIYQSLETFRETTRGQLQFISEATLATYSAVNKPGYQQQLTQPGAAPGSPGNPLTSQTINRPGTQINNTINVTQTTQNPYTQGAQVAQGMLNALPSLR